MPFLALVVLLSAVVGPSPAFAAASVTEMARFEASADAAVPVTADLFRGYLSLGLVPDAASLLERRVRLGVIPAQEAVPFFGEIVAAQGRFDEPQRLAAVCETAIRSGIGTPEILYQYGIALRAMPGRLADASGVLAQIGPEEPYGRLALYALGQIAADKGDTETALMLFRRMEEEPRGQRQGDRLASRAARSRAELLLALGRAGEAAAIFDALREKDDHLLVRIGALAAGADPVRGLDILPAEKVAEMPLEERVRFLLLLGGIARREGRLGLALVRLDRAREELEEAFSLDAPPASEPPERPQGAEVLRLQLDGWRTLRRELAAGEPGTVESLRERVVELLARLLVLDGTAARVAEASPFPYGDRLLSAGEIEEIVRRIEEVSLEGSDVDQVAQRTSARLDTLENLAHPIQRYRRLVLLERSQEEVHRLRDRIRDRREAAVAAFASGRDAEVPGLLNDMGLFLNELDRIREVAGETKAYADRYFDILRRKPESVKGAEDPSERSVRGAIAYADGRVATLLPAVSALMDACRNERWKRRRSVLVSLRDVVDRQLADTLVEQARSLRRETGDAARTAARKALSRAVSMLSSGQLGSEGAANLAIRIGSALTEGGGRWERYPPRSPDAVEKEWVARVLPLISRVASQGAAGEEALYLGAALRYAVKDPDAEAAAIRYLEQYPSSPLSAGIGIRLGHDAFLAGNIPLAVARYRAASEAGNPDASAVARYMLGWIRFQSGDAVGALRELSDPLSEPSFSCEDPSPFEQAVVSLSVRAGEEVSAAQLEAFPPVKRGACAGELFLSRLWETDRKRGNAVRAAAVRDIASRRFPLDAKAASLEVATVQGLLRAGRDDDAFSRALTLRGTYGPDSEWAKSQPPAVQDKAAGELGGTFEAIGERKFDEGIRTKARASFSAAAAMFGEYLQVMKGRLLDAEAEIRLKRAAALLGSGDRRGGVRLLEELAHEGRKDSTGERAAVLYAETMIAGFERKGEAAEAAEGAVVLLLGEHPSATAAVLGLRASVAFLAGKESLRARRTAKKVEASRFASFDQAQEARLIEAEAALFEEDFAAARETADRVLAAAGAGDNTALTARGRDLYLLSSLKEADGLASSGDPKGAAALLERLAQRFSGAPQRPLYLLGAMRMYVLGGDGDSAIRAGSRFLKEYPNKPEAVEAAGVVGPLLEEKGDIASACDLYEGLAGRFPKSEATPHFLFHAARLAEVHGPPEAAARRFASWRMRYSSPGWQWTYATLFLGLDGWRGGERKKSIRLMEEGLRKMDAGLEGDAVWELADLAGRARIAVGDAWAEQFRGIRLVAPLERNIAVKDRLFRRALAAYEKAGENSPLEIAVQADLLSADLLMAYGEAILASQRPRGLKGADRDGYEEALKVRAKSFFERSLTWCANALDRLEEEKGPSDLAAPIRTRLDTAQVLLERTVPIAGGKTQ